MSYDGVVSLALSALFCLDSCFSRHYSSVVCIARRALTYGARQILKVVIEGLKDQKRR